MNNEAQLSVVPMNKQEQRRKRWVVKRVKGGKTSFLIYIRAKKKEPKDPEPSMNAGMNVYCRHRH